MESGVQMSKDNKAFSNQKLLTVKELCEYLAIGDSTARKLLSEPNCSFVFKLGGRYYANKTALDKWIDGNTGR